MHIVDGILEPEWIIIWYTIAAVFLFFGTKEIKNRSKKDLSYMPTLAMVGAVVVVISLLHIPGPVPGSCIHLLGVPMAAIIIGPFATVVISAIALFFHIFAAHGGLTTIGANTVAMGITGAFSAFVTYIIMRRARATLWLAAGMAGFVGNISCYAMTALQLALSLFPDTVAYHWGIFMIGFAPVQIPSAIIESAFTAMVIEYVAKQRPDILAK